MARISLDTLLPSDNRSGSLIERESTLTEVAQASFLEGVNNAESSSIVRSVKLAFSRGEDDIVSHVDLNKQFPEMDIPFNEPTSLATAKLMAERARARRNRAKIIANGDTDSIAHAVVSFGANLIPQALDPVGIASGLLIGGGINKAMGLLGKQVLKPTIIRRVGEGITGNLLSETAFVLPATRMERADVNTYESLTNAVIAGIAFPVVLGAAGKTIDFLRRGKGGPDRMAKAHALAESQAQLGKRVDLEDFASAEKKASLDQLKQDLEAIPKDNLDEIANAEREITQFEDIINPDRAEVASRVNSREADLYFDTEVEKLHADAERGLEVKDPSTEAKESFSAADEELKGLESEGVLDATDIKEIKQVRADFAEIEKVDQLTKAATVCLRGS